MAPPRPLSDILTAAASPQGSLAYGFATWLEGMTLRIIRRPDRRNERAYPPTHPTSVPATKDNV